MKIILAGAGAFALEIEQYILDCNAAQRGLYDAQGAPVTSATLAGLYFEGRGRTEEFRFGPQRITDMQAHADAHWLIAIGNAEVRHSFWHRLSEHGVRFATLVHPSCVVASNARLGAGAILCPFALAANLSIIGDNAVLNTYASAGHDAHVGAHSILSPYACLNGSVQLGEACFLGTHAAVTPHKKIGAFSKVSAGAVVFNDAEAGSMIVGNPAKSRRLFMVPQ